MAARGYPTNRNKSCFVGQVLLRISFQLIHSAHLRPNQRRQYRPGSLVSWSPPTRSLEPSASGGNDRLRSKAELLTRGRKQMLWACDVDPFAASRLSHGSRLRTQFSWLARPPQGRRSVRAHRCDGRPNAGRCQWDPVCLRGAERRGGRLVLFSAVLRPDCHPRCRTSGS